jgi:hypothetical protein
VRTGKDRPVTNAILAAHRPEKDFGRNKRLCGLPLGKASWQTYWHHLAYLASLAPETGSAPGDAEEVRATVRADILLDPR